MKAKIGLRTWLPLSVLFVSLGILSACEENATTNDDPGSQEVSLNGCTSTTGNDMRGNDPVIITDISPWGLGHSACIIVDVGTTVTWNGNFDTHPLVGGESPTVDSASPITIASPMSGTNPVSITFPETGDFGYYCNSHSASMLGAVYAR